MRTVNYAGLSRFAMLLMALSGHSQHRNILFAIGVTADNGKPLLANFDL
jgi:hypothetical protein